MAKPHLLESPRDPGTYNTCTDLAYAHLHARQYAAGLDSARRATSAAPGFVPAHLAAVLLHVGLAQIDEARAALETARALAPQLVQARLEGHSAASISTDRRRCTTLLRIAAGLEYPSTADALR